jgi:hypothetical protein
MGDGRNALASSRPKEAAMISTVDVPIAARPAHNDGGDLAWASADERPESDGASGLLAGGCASSRFDLTQFSVLLDDPAIALWARDAAARYDVSVLDALGLLAQALADPTDQ